MATIQPVVTDVSATGGVRTVKWSPVATGDVCAPIRLDRWNVTSFQAFGTVTSLAYNGSNDADAPTNFNTLSDWQGVALTGIAAAGYKTPRDMPIWVQPVLTTGAGVTIQMAMHRADIGQTG